MDANIVTAIDNPDLLSGIVLLNCTDHSICEIADAEHGPHEVRQSFAVGAVFHRHQCDCRLTKRRMDLMCSPVARIVAWHADQNLPGDDLRGEALKMSLSRINPFAIQGVELPVMSTTRQNRAVQIALDEGDPLMGAAPLIGTQASIKLE